MARHYRIANANVPSEVLCEALRANEREYPAPPFLQTDEGKELVCDLLNLDEVDYFNQSQLGTPDCLVLGPLRDDEETFQSIVFCQGRASLEGTHPLWVIDYTGRLPAVYLRVHPELSSRLRAFSDGDLKRFAAQLLIVERYDE